MSYRHEQMLMQHLVSRDSLEVLGREGLPEECVATEDLRRVYLWAMDRFFRGGLSKAPSVGAMRAEWGDLLDDHEIDLEDDPEDTIEAVIDSLKGTYIWARAADFNRRMSTSLAEATTEERVAVLNEYAGELVRLSTDMEIKDVRVDARQGFQDRLVAYEARSQDKDEVYGMRFGMKMLDEYTRGIHPGELAIIAAGPKVGKALAVGTRVMTPRGWVKVEDIKPGDEVMGSAGPTRVLATAGWSQRPLMRVVLDDGGEVTVDEAHDWTIFPHSHGRRVQLVDTGTLGEKILTNRRFAYLPMPEPIDAPDQDLPLDPYLLGLLIGDGGMTIATTSFTSADAELHQAVVDLLPEGVSTSPRKHEVQTVGLVGAGKGHTNPLTQVLRDLGLMGCRSETKFIPEVYMRGSADQRFALLQGLMDTDGGVDGKGLTFCTTSPVLARQVQELVWSLGGTARVKEKPIEKGLDAFVVRMRLSRLPFRLQRKIEAYAQRGAVRTRPPSRRVVEVVPAGVGDTICLQVDAPDSLFMVEDYILTHNSFLMAHVGLKEWQAGKVPVLFTLENSVEMTLDRLAVMATRVSYRAWQQGELPPDDLERVREWIEAMSNDDHPFHILQPPPGARSVEALVKQAQILGADTLLIDQLSYLEARDERQPRHLQIREITHALRGMISSGRHKVPCLLAHQINREGVKAADKNDYLEMLHLAEGSETERTADWVFGIYRSKMEVGHSRAKFQTLAARREVPKHFMLQWDVSVGHIAALSEWVPPEKEG